MITIINNNTNFVRIFRLPIKFPSGFCFAGGYPVSIQLVDWFNPHGGHINSPLSLDLEAIEAHRNEIREFVRQKEYFKNYPDHNFLAITDYGDSYLISH